MGFMGGWRKRNGEWGMGKAEAAMLLVSNRDALGAPRTSTDSERPTVACAQAPRGLKPAARGQSIEAV